MQLRSFLVIACLVACGPIPRPRPRPDGAPELCAHAGATAPVLHAINLWPSRTDPVMSFHPDMRLAAALEAMKPRATLPGTTPDLWPPRFHPINDRYFLALFPVLLDPTPPWAGDMRRVYWWTDRAWLGYVWDATSDVWTFVGVGKLGGQLPGARDVSPGLFLGVASQDLGTRGPGYHDVVLGESVRLRRLADTSAGQITGVSAGMPVLWRRDGAAVVLSCMSATGPVAHRRIRLPEGFEPADGDAVRDQRVLLVQKDPLQVSWHSKPGPAFAARVWILDLDSGRLRFIGKAPGRYYELATNNPYYAAVASAAWRDSGFNPYVDLTPEDKWGEIELGGGPSAYVEVASERVVRAR